MSWPQGITSNLRDVRFIKVFWFMNLSHVNSDTVHQILVEKRFWRSLSITWRLCFESYRFDIFQSGPNSFKRFSGPKFGPAYFHQSLASGHGHWAILKPIISLRNDRSLVLKYLKKLFFMANNSFMGVIADFHIRPVKIIIKLIRW